MPYPLDDKLVIATSSTALFDFSDAHAVYAKDGVDAFRAFQREHIDVPAKPGVAFRLIEKLLRLNTSGAHLVEVILISRNDPFSGLRLFNSARESCLNITRGVFTGGSDPFDYIRPLRPMLFLSTEEGPVREALEAGIPAAMVGHQCSAVADLHKDELRLAFDGDGVLFGDGSERVNLQFGIQAFREYERTMAQEPLNAGPLWPFVNAIKRLQGASGLRTRIALITSRGAPAHERALRTLDSWGIEVNEAMFLGGLDKSPFIKAFAPDIFFDDQKVHIEAAVGVAAVAHVPFGVTNETSTSTKAG